MKIAVIHENAEALLADHGPLLRVLAGLGHEVNAVAPGSGPETGAGIEALGVEYAMFPLTARGFTPLGDLGSLLHLKQVLFRIRPSLILSVAAKPSVYGSLAARMAWVGEAKRVFCLLEEPGYPFDAGGFGAGLRAAVARAMLRAGFRSCDGIAFRTPEAETFFRGLGVLQPEARTVVLGEPDPERQQAALLEFLGMIPAD